MLERDTKFLEEAFKQYYFDHFDLIHVPDRPNQREFGYKKFIDLFVHLRRVRNKKPRALIPC